MMARIPGRRYAVGQAIVIAAVGALACNGDQFQPDAGDAGQDGPPIIGGGGDGGADAATDAPKEASVVPRFCDSIDASFCADFDTPNDAGAGFFSPPNTTNGYALSFETTLVKSTPTALQVDVPADAGGTANLETLVGTPDAAATSTLTLDLDVYLPNIPTPSSQALFAFTFGAFNDPVFSFGLAHEGAWRFERVAGTPNVPISPQPATNEWAHVTLTILLNATGGAVTLDLTTSAGTSHTVLTNVATAPSGPPTIPGGLRVGAQCLGPTNASASFYYDNAVVRLQ